MKLGSYNFGGTLTLVEDIDLDQAPHQQELSLVEDMMNVSYQNGLLLDIGWSDEFNPNDRFVVSVVKYGDWEHPKLKKEIDYNEILKSLDTIINDYIKNL